MLSTGCQDSVNSVLREIEIGSYPQLGWTLFIILIHEYIPYYQLGADRGSLNILLGKDLVIKFTV